MASTTTALKNIPVARPEFGREEEQAVAATLRTGWVSQGPRVAEFEKQFSAYVGVEHAVAVSSCATALHLAMLTAGIGAGDEVICPSLSFIATANCIRYVGGRPVFVDVDPSTYNTDPERLEAAITPRTKAILAVHQVGLPSPMDEISRIAKKHGLLVMEDAAPAAGAEYRGEKIGKPHSWMACFSFDGRKPLCCGEGGMITTNDAELAGRLRRLRTQAMTVSDLARHSSRNVVSETYPEVGYNYRMTDIQGSIGLVQLSRLDGFIEKRRYFAHRYTAAFAKLGWLSGPGEPADCKHNFQSYIARVERNAPLTRDQLMQALLERGISTRAGIMAIHRELPYQDPAWNDLLPESNKARDETLILPLYTTMSDDEHDYVIQAIEEIGTQASR